MGSGSGSLEICPSEESTPQVVSETQEDREEGIQ